MTNKLRCSYCDKDFKYESEKRRHEISHSPRFVCKICDKKFSYVSALKRHEKQHQRIGRVECSQCNRSFRDESLLKRHIKYAHKGNYTCGKCKTEFHSELALSIHKKTHISKADRRYHCSYSGCGKTFNFPHHLKHHELTHGNIKQHYCQICLKGFIQYHHLKAHMNTHEPDKWLHCIQIDCKKKFSTEYSRKRHILNVHNIKLEDISASESSQDGCDMKFDTILCTSCGEIVELAQHDEHKLKCSVDHNAIDASEGNYEDSKKDSVNNTNINDCSPDINDCKSVLGMCIVNSDSSDKCLCAQIKTTVEDYCDDITNLIENENSVSVKPNMLPDEPYRANVTVNTSCVNCECSGILQCNNFSTPTDVVMNVDQHIRNTIDNSLNNVKSNMPDIEYKIDGSIKLKDTFDSDIPIFENIKAKKYPEDNIDSYKNNYVPFKSCKDVLGKCIVSGNSTISEGCLCAKMLVEDQQVSAEEIDEITPKPTAYTNLSVI